MTEVDSFPQEFYTFINDNLETVTQDLQSSGVSFTQASTVKSLFLETSAPTASAVPSAVKSDAPTMSPAPSQWPSVFPSQPPNLKTFPPVPNPTLLPAQPADDDDGKLGVGAIAGIILGSGLAVLAGLVVFYYRWTRKPHAQEDGFHSDLQPVADLLPPDEPRRGGEGQLPAAEDANYSPAYKDSGRSVAGESSPNVARVPVSQVPVFAEAVLLVDEDQQ